MTLADFLRARLDEDCDQADLVKDWVGAGGPVGEVIRVWNPARIKAEVTAKRAILDATPWSLIGEPEYGSCPDCGDDTAIRVHEATLRILAQAYADHPGYLPEWRMQP